MDARRMRRANVRILDEWKWKYPAGTVNHDQQTDQHESLERASNASCTILPPLSDVRCGLGLPKRNILRGISMVMHVRVRRVARQGRSRSGI